MTKAEKWVARREKSNFDGAFRCPVLEVGHIKAAGNQPQVANMIILSADEHNLRFKIDDHTLMRLGKTAEEILGDLRASELEEALYTAIRAGNAPLAVDSEWVSKETGERVIYQLKTSSSWKEPEFPTASASVEMAPLSKAPTAPVRAGLSVISWIAKCALPLRAAEECIENWRSDLAYLPSGPRRWFYLLSQMRSLPQLVWIERTMALEGVGGK